MLTNVRSLVEIADSYEIAVYENGAYRLSDASGWNPKRLNPYAQECESSRSRTERLISIARALLMLLY